MADTPETRDSESLTAERIARNDSIFREANERIRDAAQSHGIDGPIPFICECAEPRCRELVRLTLTQYADVRRDPRRFFVMPGHEAVAGRFAERVGSGGGYHVVEKQGLAGQVAEELADGVDSVSASLDPDAPDRDGR
jgi:hypothetical protein